MLGTLYRPARITRAMLRANPTALFAFGDNMVRRGLGGQAKEMRGEPNAVGVPTKWRPGREKGDYFTDADGDLLVVRAPIVEAFRQMREALTAGRDVYIPADGLGTGLADLPRRAPRIHKAIEARIEVLMRLAERVVTEPERPPIRTTMISNRYAPPLTHADS